MTYPRVVGDIVDAGTVRRLIQEIENNDRKLAHIKQGVALFHGVGTASGYRLGSKDALLYVKVDSGGGQELVVKFGSNQSEVTLASS